VAIECPMLSCAIQVVIAMSGGEIIYFELAAAGTLIETERKEVGGDVASLDIAPIPLGRQRSRFLAMGGSDSMVSAFFIHFRIMSTHRWI